jgi:hypothetical protein
MTADDVQRQREAVARQIMAATTDAELAAASRAAKEWLDLYPDDRYVLAAGEQLTLKIMAARLTDADRVAMGSQRP